VRTVLVTGASSGIGAACALELARRREALVLCARRADRLAEVAARAREAGASDVVSFTLDVREREAVERWGGEQAALLARVDVLVNSAGLARGFGPLAENDPDDWDEMIDTNVKGLLYVTKALLPHLVARRGHVVNIGSVAGHSVYPKGAVYCASKFAERAITEGLRMDLVGSGVRVSTVDPGMVETEFSLVRFHGDAPRAARVYDGMTPLRAADIAETIAWIVDRPAHVNIAEVVILPTDQASPTLVHRRG
jgi:NADP-dependent 3-hydroxy acid dehydrogenase YdfG